MLTGLVFTGLPLLPFTVRLLRAMFAPRVMSSWLAGAAPLSEKNTFAPAPGVSADAVPAPSVVQLPATPITDSYPLVPPFQKAELNGVTVVGVMVTAVADCPNDAV